MCKFWRGWRWKGLVVCLWMVWLFGVMVGVVCVWCCCCCEVVGIGDGMVNGCYVEW